jgi:hypothetical protein
MEVSLSTIINRPSEEIFAALTNLENDLKWRSEWVDARKTTDGPIGIGTRFSLFAKAFGRRIETVYETIQYEPNWVGAWRAMSGPIPLTFQRTFESVEGGTRLTTGYQAELRGFMKLLMSFMIGSAKKHHEDEMRRLKELMETRAL